MCRRDFNVRVHRLCGYSLYGHVGALLDVLYEKPRGELVFVRGAGGACVLCDGVVHVHDEKPLWSEVRFGSLAATRPA